MKFVWYKADSTARLAVESEGQWFDAGQVPLDALLAQGEDLVAFGKAAVARGSKVAAPQAHLPVVPNPPKIICVGLNYADHVSEGSRPLPEFPTFFLRTRSGLLAHGEPMVVPRVSEQLDFEGELAAVIGKGGRYIRKQDALEHVAGYTIFNDGSVRDFQRRTQQWTLGKNFDATGPLGPCFLTADELPAGGRDLRLVTRLDGEVMQETNTSNMIFDLATVIEAASEAMTLEPGDIIATGTPSGVGAWRKPPRWMKPGSVCEVEIERLGVLQSPIVAES